ncbi:TetR/AcrR family transcriptional regulator [Actinomadura fibrosa]|uniref:TetR/AcrR family transcriptional regulator n=1 Tax=Actinomadura fibrosa TaxID=111802 RepID=A0ABW2XAD9_9ACTN|nr:TetR/AcrR family transcriptional regulator [Actinomadura fibrosa]
MDESPPRTRRRGAALEATILEAAWDELAAVGYSRLTMEGVAARARTGKQVLYRRWRNRPELVIAAVRHHTGSIADEVIDTGELRGDVLTVLRRMVQRQRDLGPDLVHGLMADAPDLDPRFFTIMHGVMTTVLQRAAERGELETADLPSRVVTLPVDLLRHEMLLTSNPIAETTLTEIVDQVFLPLLAPRSAGS